jgi:hypothetical protein
MVNRVGNLGRLVPTVPRWTSHESEGRRNGKPHVQSGLRFVGGAKCWCYRCKSEHRWEEGCYAPEPAGPVAPDTRVPCTYCGVLFLPGPSARGRNRYCSPPCHRAVKSARARKGYDGRYDP